MIIYLKNVDYNKSLSESDNYQFLLNTLHNIFEFNKDIISNLLELNLIEHISNIKVLYLRDEIEYNFPNTVKLINNYENCLPYIFASYSLFDNNFKIKNKKNSCILINEKNESYLELFYSFGAFYIYYKIKLDTNLLIPYDINLLNKNEIDSLDNSIKKQTEKLITNNKHSFLNGHYYLYVVLVIHEDIHFNDITEYIKMSIENHYSNYLSSLNTLKKSNEIFFERPLLDSEIQRF